eukprot:11049465-Prorocentrum_lima.AAC.1
MNTTLGSRDPKTETPSGRMQVLLPLYLQEKFMPEHYLAPSSTQMARGKLISISRHLPRRLKKI